MATLQVDTLCFVFRKSVAAQKYDEWVHHQKVLRKQDRKAVDIVAMRMGNLPPEVWLIEAKDFREITRLPGHGNVQELAPTMLRKTEDTLAGLADAAMTAQQTMEREHAVRALAAQGRRVVLHLEPHSGAHSKLFPRNFAAGVLQKLRQLVRHIDPHPLVLNIATTPASGVSWTVA